MARTRNLIKDYPDEALLEEVRRAAGLVERPVLRMPISRSTRDFRRCSCQAIRKLAGDVGTLGFRRHVAGEPENQASLSRKYSDEELLEEVRHVAEQAGKRR